MAEEIGAVRHDLGYLEKPFTPDILLRKVREVLGPPARARKG